MTVCMVLVDLAITCVHDYMAVTVKNSKIYGKMNFNRWTLAITAVPTTLTLTMSDNWLRTSAVIYIYKVRARRNGYRIFISVYILWPIIVHRSSKFIITTISVVSYIDSL